LRGVKAPQLAAAGAAADAHICFVLCARRAYL
jgi:hypothetical protein